MDPHYTRKDTQRQFLGSELNITKMYRLYKLECAKLHKKPVGGAKYRKVFCEEYNYSFHTPKKDQCRVCNLHQQQEENGTLTEDAKRLYAQHISRKIRAREEKQFDKDYSKKNMFYHTVTFDLQAVLHCPCSNVSQVYYKRKLNCYNLSVYSLGNAKATCFMWNETEGNRGSNEIASSLLLYLKSLPSTTSHVCLYSDSCSGQNRNRHVTAALLHGVLTINNIRTIDQKYLEHGHTEMECDSMHAAVEAAKKCTSVFVPSQWDTIVRMARKRKPYTVVPLKYTDIIDFKDVSSKIFPLSIVDTNGKKVKWLQIKWIQFRQHEPDSIFFKYEFDEEEFHCIKIKAVNAKRISTRGAKKISEIERPEFQIGISDLKYCYDNKIPISDAKKKDLLALCKDGTIPEEYQSYYNNIPSDSTVKDMVPEPDLYDEMDDE